MTVDVFVKEMRPRIISLIIIPIIELRQEKFCTINKHAFEVKTKMKSFLNIMVILTMSLVLFLSKRLDSGLTA